MSCSVAVSNSPVFSPSRVVPSIFCSKASMLSPSAESLSLTLTHLKPSPSPSNTCSSSSSSPLSPSPASPFRLRLQKPPTGLSNSSSSAPVPVPGSGSSPTTVLKRKRPGRLDIPVAALSFGDPATPSASANDVVAEEREEYGYSVYCKRERRKRKR